MERVTKVTPYWVSLHCDECPTSPEMQNTGTKMIDVRGTATEYLFRCPNCNANILTDKSYPRIDWRKEKEDEENASTP